MAKKIRIPSITGYILAGIVIGRSGLDLISDRTMESMETLNHIALGLMALTIGTHVNFHRLRNSGKRVAYCSFFENVFTFVLVYVTFFYGLHMDRLFSLVLAAISVSTAPVTTIAIVQETKSRGTLVSTLLPMVAVNNVTCILLFGLVANALGYGTVPGNSLLSNIWHVGLGGVKVVIIALVLGIIMGYILNRYSVLKKHHHGELLTGIFFLVMATAGVALSLNLNPMLPCLFMGIVISNWGTNRKEVTTAFEEIQHIIIVIFFGMAGTHVSFSQLSTAGLFVLIYFFVRAAGKLSGSFTGGLVANIPFRITKYIGPTLLPQAGVAVGLVIFARDIPQLSNNVDFLTTIVLAAVALNEIIAPPLVKWSLIKAKEANKDRAKLIEFLGEDYILPDVKATEKTAAIKELTKFLLKSHDVSEDIYEKLVQTVLDREAKMPTGIGEGVAIPHGMIEEGPDIWGVIGLSRKGIHFDSLDGKPVHLLVLIVTPKAHVANKHIKILAENSKINARPPGIITRCISCKALLASFTFLIPKLIVTISKLSSAKGMAVASPCSSETTSCKFLANIFCRPCWSMFSARSNPTALLILRLGRRNKI